VHRARLLAVAASGLLGVVAGVVGGLLLDGGTGAIVDPLGLGVAQVDQPCTGKTLLVVARGDGAAQLGSTVATEGDGVRYLDTRKSCKTGWVDPSTPRPRYAAYLGPYSSPSQACPVRMTVGHPGSEVVQLASGTPEPVQCLCYVSFSSMPVMREGKGVLDSTGMYVRALQRMLTDLGLNPEAHQNGFYDLRTERQIRQFQHDRVLRPTGTTNTQTWQALIHQGCKDHPS
jgi:hypothetical protein